VKNIQSGSREENFELNADQDWLSCLRWNTWEFKEPDHTATMVSRTIQQFDSVNCTFAMAISHLAGRNWGISGLESAKLPRTGVPKIPVPGVKPNYGFPSWWSLPIPVSLTQHVET
jgi:hypothetical protein